MSNLIELYFDERCLGRRLDQLITERVDADFSRARVQSIIKEGFVVHVETGEVLKQASLKFKEPATIQMTVPPLKNSTIDAEDIPLNVVYEDDSLLVINKPAGLVVHPGAGNWSGTLVNALLHHCKGTLSGIGGVERPGIVHRLDKETSGLMIVAKTDQAHHALSAQLADRSLKRTYWAFVWGVPMPPRGTIDTLYGRDPYHRIKMAVLKRDGKEAITDYRVLSRMEDDLYSLVECQLHTGRTHQIRVHMAHLGYPLIGDPLYGRQATAIQAAVKKSEVTEEIEAKLLQSDRQALHAKEISFIHPVSEDVMLFETDLPDELKPLFKE